MALASGFKSAMSSAGLGCCATKSQAEPARWVSAPILKSDCRKPGKLPLRPGSQSVKAWIRLSSVVPRRPRSLLQTAASRLPKWPSDTLRLMRQAGATRNIERNGVPPSTRMPFRNSVRNRSQRWKWGTSCTPSSLSGTRSPRRPHGCGAGLSWSWTMPRREDGVPATIPHDGAGTSPTCFRPERRSPRSSIMRRSRGQR